jgi:uncharacterized protein
MPVFQTKKDKPLNVPFKIKSVDEEKNVFEGYASVFRNVDSYGDIVEPGAFAKTIQERGDKVKVLWQHDPYTPIGKAVELHEDNHGLYVKAQIFDTAAGRDAMTLIKGGVIDELSIGYRTVKDEWDNEKGVRRLKELQLFEFSPVTFAANDQAAILGAKSMGERGQDIAFAFAAIEEMKAGKVLSEKSKMLVKNAIEALENLLKSADNEPENEPKNDEMTDAEMKEMQELMSDMKKSIKL